MHYIYFILTVVVVVIVINFDKNLQLQQAPFLDVPHGNYI